MWRISAHLVLTDALLFRQEPQTEGVTVVHALLIKNLEHRLPVQTKQPAKGVVRPCREGIDIFEFRHETCRLFSDGFKHHPQIPFRVGRERPQPSGDGYLV